MLGNGHPSKLIPMERQLQGVHTAATKERFLICVDVSVPRHAALPQHMLRADPNLLEWTWLPLTPFQAGVFGWEDMLDNLLTSSTPKQCVLMMTPRKTLLSASKD